MLLNLLLRTSLEIEKQHSQFYAQMLVKDLCCLHLGCFQGLGTNHSSNYSRSKPLL